MEALGYVAHNPGYVIGDKIVCQVSHGVCQTGDAVTTWQDNWVRIWNSVMRNGIVTAAGESYLLDAKLDLMT